MKNATVITLAAIMAVLLTAVSAFAWGFAVHTYVADRIGKSDGDPNLNEAYGATLPDLFNYAFAMPPGLFQPTCSADTLFAITHTTNHFDIVDQKNTGLGKSLAVGFVSHNQAGGADRTAHEAAVLTGQPGYVVEKAYILQGLLESVQPSPYYPPPLSAVLPGITQDEAHQLYHSVVEYSVDLLVAQQAPEVAPLMIAGASFWPTGYLPPVLTDAFADEVGSLCFYGDETMASAYISLVEMAHRQGVFDEGTILTLPPDTARLYTANRLAALAILYLGYSLDPADANYMDPGPLAQLADAYLQVATMLCQDDYSSEVEATVEMVRHNLAEEEIIKDREEE